MPCCMQLEVTISREPKMSREDCTFTQARERREFGSHSGRLFRFARVSAPNFQHWSPTHRTKND